MRRYFLKKGVATALLATITMSQCISPTLVQAAGTNTAQVKTIRLNKKTLTLEKGKAANLKVTISPKLAKNAKLVWKSSRPSVATVSTKGRVTARRAGTTRITVTAKESKKSASCTVKVLTPVSKVTVTPNKVTLGIKERVTLKTKITPSRASYQTVVFQSMNPKVVAVNRRGILEGRSAGETKVVVQVKNTSKKVTVPVTVKDTETEPSVTPSVSKPTETSPSKTAPSVSKPTEAVPSETVPTVSKPSETSPSVTAPTVSKPTEAAPSGSIYPTEIQTYRGGRWTDTGARVSYDETLKSIIVLGNEQNYEAFISNNSNSALRPKFVCAHNQNIVYVITEENGVPYLKIKNGSAAEEKVEIRYEYDITKAKIEEFSDGDNYLINWKDSGVECDENNRKYNLLTVEGEKDILSEPTGKLTGADNAACVYTAVQGDKRGCGTLTFRTQLQEKVYWIRYTKTQEKISLLPTNAYYDMDEKESAGTLMPTEVDGQEALGIVGSANEIESWMVYSYYDDISDQYTKKNVSFVNEKNPLLQYTLVKEESGYYLNVTKGKETKTFPIVYEKKIYRDELTFTDGENLLESIDISSGDRINVSGENETLTDPKLTSDGITLTNIYQNAPEGSSYTGTLTISTQLQKKQYFISYKKVEVSLLPTEISYTDEYGDTLDFYADIKKFKDGTVEKVGILGKSSRSSENVNIMNLHFENSKNPQITYEVTEDRNEWNELTGYSLHIKIGTKGEKVYPLYYEPELSIYALSSDYEQGIQFQDGENYIVSWNTTKKEDENFREYDVLVVEGENAALSNQAKLIWDGVQTECTCQEITGSKKGGQLLTVKTKLQTKQLWIRYHQTEKQVDYLPDTFQYWNKGEDPKYDEPNQLKLQCQLLNNADGTQSVGIVGEKDTLEEDVKDLTLQIKNTMNPWITYEWNLSDATFMIKPGTKEARTYPIVYEKKLDKDNIRTVTDGENYILDTIYDYENDYEDNIPYIDRYKLFITGENPALSEPKAVFQDRETISEYTPMENNKHGCGILKVSTLSRMQTVTYWVKYTQKIHTLELKDVTWPDGSKEILSMGWRNIYTITSTQYPLEEAKFTFDVDGVTDVAVKAISGSGDREANYEITVAYKGEQQIIRVYYTQSKSEMEDDIS